MRAAVAEAQFVPRKGELPDDFTGTNNKPLCAKVDGITLHAARGVEAHDREGLEQLCRYGLRAPFARDRFSLDPDGRVRYQLAKPWPTPEGKTELCFEPPALLRRLAALIPAPYHNLPSMPPPVAASWLTTAEELYAEVSDYDEGDPEWRETGKDIEGYDIRGPPGRPGDQSQKYPPTRSQAPFPNHRGNRENSEGLPAMPHSRPSEPRQRAQRPSKHILHVTAGLPIFAPEGQNRDESSYRLPARAFAILP